MRSLSDKTLSTLIADSIINNDSFDFLDSINEKELATGCILTAPSASDKIILLNAINIILHHLIDNDKYISSILKSISEVYNESNIKYIYDSHVDTYKLFITQGKYLNLEKISIIDKNSVATINDLFIHGTLYEHENTKIAMHVQLFIYASVWFDMDEYLEYLYYLYK